MQYDGAVSANFKNMRMKLRKVISFASSLCLLSALAFWLYFMFFSQMDTLHQESFEPKTLQQAPMHNHAQRTEVPNGRSHAYGGGAEASSQPPSATLASVDTGTARLRQLVVAPETQMLSVEELAAEKSQVMDELLEQAAVPSDYGKEMVSLYRDQGQDVYTRDFAVQHIGLYAETMNRRGMYDPNSAESVSFRRALWDASNETDSIIAAAAFRALADMAAFDSQVDVRRLDARLVSCAGDDAAASAARVMAVQLCGERRLTSARATLNRIASDHIASAALRKAVEWSLRELSAQTVNGKAVAQ